MSDGREVGGGRSVLVGSDLTGDALAALEAGAIMARADGGLLHLLHATDPGLHRSQASLLELLQEQAAHLASDGIEVHLHVESGSPFRVLAAAAERLGAELLVLGSHRPRRVFDGLLGTTADRVIRTSPLPVLLVNRALGRVPRRILLATDFSPAADRALEVMSAWVPRWAAAAAEEEEEGGAFLEVVNVAAFAHPAFRPVSRVEPMRERCRRLEAALGGQVRVRPRILSAPLAPEGILQAAQESHVDLVVLGAHGHGLLARSLLGSVASEVVRTVPFPILVVPPG